MPYPLSRIHDCRTCRLSAPIPPSAQPGGKRCFTPVGKEVVACAQPVVDEVEGRVHVRSAFVHLRLGGTAGTAKLRCATCSHTNGLSSQSMPERSSAQSS